MGDCRIGVLSDSHQGRLGIQRVMAKLQKDGPLHYLCFLGDCVSDLPVIEACLTDNGGTTVYAVRGNNDFATDLPAEIVVFMGGKKFLLTHGHKYRVKIGLLGLSLRAQEAEADAALFGHTHASYCAYEGGVLLVNPGAAGGKAPTGALLIVSDGQIDARIVEA